MTERDSNMIYTSRYQNHELRSGLYTVVGITRGAPRFALGYTLAGNILDIAPPSWLFNENNRSIFTQKYCQNIQAIGVKRLTDILTGYTQLGKDLVLCCYEDVRKPNEWCHRLVFAEWWKEQTGEIIPELHDQSTPAAAKPCRVDGAQKEVASPKDTSFQLSLV